MPAPNFNDLYDLGMTEAIIRRPDLAVREGDISDMLIAGAAAMADRIIGYAAERFAATYLDGARGADLTTLCQDHWGVVRHAANPAAGTVTITRAGATLASASWPIGTIVATARDAQGTEIRFLTTQAANWLGGVNGAVTVNVEADIPGRDGNLATVDQITRLISDSPGAGTYTITASSITAGGSEEETDEELRSRTRAYPLTLRRGTLDALEYGALQIASVRRATAVEDSGGIVTVYVSDIDGASTGGTVTVSESVSDDGTMTHDVARELQEWRAAGSLVNVTGGLLQTVDITVVLTVRAGADVLAITTQIEDAIEGAVNRLRIGETLYKNTIATAARMVDPDNILECEVTLPATNTAPTGAGYIIRAGTITVS